MFREKPALAPHFLEPLFHLDVPPHATVTVGETALDQLLPVEYRADLVLELRDAAGALVLAIVLEVQRDEDPGKKYTLPCLRRGGALEEALPGDRARGGASFEGGGLGSGADRARSGPRDRQAAGLGPAIVPVVTDETEAMREAELAILSSSHGEASNARSGEAMREAELAILSVVAHGNRPVALAALGRLDLEHAAVYFQIIHNALREPTQRAREAKIMERQSEVKVTYPPFMQRLIEGGKLEGKSDTLVRLLRRAGIAFTTEDDARVKACADAETLDRWVDSVLTAKTIAAVLA